MAYSGDCRLMDATVLLIRDLPTVEKGMITARIGRCQDA